MADNPKIDRKDKKILEELDWDARITNSKISKKVGLSKKGVEYRIKRLEKLGVITGYYPFINFMSLGYNYCRMFIKLQYMNDSVRSQMESFIKSNKDFNWSLGASGSYDLVIGMWTKSLRDFKENSHKFILKFDKFIKFKKFSLGIQLDQFSYNFLLEETPKKYIQMKEEFTTKKIDKNDFMILSELTKDARMSIIDIANKVKLYPSTVKQRLNKLIENKILLKTRVALDHSKLDYIHFKLFIHLSYNSVTDIQKMKQYLLKNPNVIYFVDEIGISDLDLELLLKSSSDLLKIIRDLQEKFSDLIKDYSYLIFTDTIKINFIPADLVTTYG